MNPDSEAMGVFRKILQEMKTETKRDGKKFVLVYLPYEDDLLQYKQNPSYRSQYSTMKSVIATEGIASIDLMKYFLKNGFDRGYDGTHYGPKTNKMISDALWDNFKKLKLVPAQKADIEGLKRAAV